MNVNAVLSDLKINPTESVNRIIKDIGIQIELKPDRLAAANDIITKLGAPAATKERTAIVLAKGLVEQAVLLGDAYQPEAAMTVVAGKYMKLVDDLPSVYSIKKGAKSLANTEGTTTSGRASRKNNDKKAAALAIFEANKSLGNSDIAKMIATELEITFANAYYYVTRVFKR